MENMKTEAGQLFIKDDVVQLLANDDQIDVIILGCTHYPILKSYIESIVPSHVKVIAQGPIIAEKLEDYLIRHPEIEKVCSKNSITRFFNN
jgi:glutamate racemase